MFEQLVVLFLVGLGVKTPVLPGTVMGDQTEVKTVQETSESTEVETEIETETETSKNTQKQKVKMEVKPSRVKVEENNKIRTAKQEMEQVMKKELQGRTASSGSDFRNKDFIAERKMIQEKFVQDVKNHRASASATFKAEREAFQNRLQTIKDTAKKTKLENVSQVISQVNSNRTTIMANKLTTMDEIIAKITTGLSTLSEGGRDTSAAQVALSAANTAISAAKSAVATQAGKEYVIGITSENNLGEDVSRARTTLATDLKAVETAITHARQAVSDAIAAYASLKGEPAL